MGRINLPQSRRNVCVLTWMVSRVGSRNFHTETWTCCDPITSYNEWLHVEPMYYIYAVTWSTITLYQNTRSNKSLLVRSTITTTSLRIYVWLFGYYYFLLFNNILGGMHSVSWRTVWELRLMVISIVILSTQDRALVLSFSAGSSSASYSLHYFPQHLRYPRSIQYVLFAFITTVARVRWKKKNNILLYHTAIAK